MSQTDFKSSLSSLDVDAISSSQIKAVKSILKEMDVTPQRMQEISSAGAGLLKFVLAIVGKFLFKFRILQCSKTNSAQAYGSCNS